MIGAEPPWTQTNINDLRAQAYAGQVLAAIADTLCRSEADVARMAARLRIKLTTEASRLRSNQGVIDEQGTESRQSRGAEAEEGRAETERVQSIS